MGEEPLFLTGLAFPANDLCSAVRIEPEIVVLGFAVAAAAAFAGLFGYLWVKRFDHG
jgi:hypothetical protein